MVASPRRGSARGVCSLSQIRRVFEEWRKVKGEGYPLGTLPGGAVGFRVPSRAHRDIVWDLSFAWRAAGYSEGFDGDSERTASVGGGKWRGTA